MHAEGDGAAAIGERLGGIVDVTVHGDITELTARGIDGPIVRIVVPHRISKSELKADRREGSESDFGLDEKLIDLGVGFVSRKDIEVRKIRIDRGRQQSLILSHARPRHMRCEATS